MVEDLLTQEIAAIQHIAAIVLILWLLPLFAYAIDFWTGIEGARAQGEELHSGGFRRTIIKIGEYWRVQFMALLIDIVGSLVPQYTIPWISMVATVVIIFIEYKSVQENFRKKKTTHATEAMGLSNDILSEIVNAKNGEQAKVVAKRLLNKKDD